MPRGGLDGGASGSLRGGVSGGLSGVSASSYAQPTAQSVHRLGEVTEQFAEARARREEIRGAVDMVQGTPQGLRSLLRGQFGTCVCGWRRALDRHGSHRLPEDAFVRTLRDMGFPNARGVFFDLGGATGHVRLKDLDPGGASLLDNFYRVFTRGVGPLSSLTAGVDQRLTREQFLQKCKPIQRGEGKAGGIGREGLEGVFRALQLGGKAGVTAADLAWLEGSCNPPERPSSSALPLWQSSRPATGSTTLPSRSAQGSRQSQRASRVVDDFRDALRRGYGGVVQAWRQLLDPRGKSEVEPKGLKAACEEIGFVGSVDELWQALVRPPGTALKLEMLEPVAPEALKSFRQCCSERFGSTAQAFRNWAAAERPIVTLKEFYIFCDEVRMPRNQRMLFELLDTRGAGKVSMAAVDPTAACEAFGEDACQDADDALAELAEAAEESRGSPRARRSLRAQQLELCAASRRPPGERRSRREELARLLEARFGSLARAWHKQFDIGGAGKISREAFFEGCAAVGFHGGQSALCAELKLEDGAPVRFRDLAPELVDATKTFKDLASGKLADWCTVVESEAKDPKRAKKHGTGVSREKFTAFCVSVDYEGDVDKLLSCLDLEGDGAVSTKVLRSFVESTSEEKALPRLLAKHAERRRRHFRKKAQGTRLPSAADVAAKQDELRRSARRKRAVAGRGKSAKQEFLVKLRAQFGSVGKAWRLGLDPEDFGDLDEKEFVEALSQIGFLPPERECSDDDFQKGTDLFLELAHEEKGGKGEEAEQLVSLHDLDPETNAAIEQFKEQCRLRYRGMAQAFEEVDPDGTGTIGTELFRHWCIEMNCSNRLRRLLDYLDAGGAGHVKLEDIDEDAAEKCQEAAERRREIEETRREEDEEKGRTQFKAPPPIGVAVGVEACAEKRATEAKRKAANSLKLKLTRKYGTLLSAWRKSLNTEGTTAVGIHQFVRACEKEGITPEDTTKAWEGMGPNLTRITLEQFDPSIKISLNSFKLCLASRYGSVKAGLECADKNKDFMLSKQEFLALCYECQWKGNELHLFEYLDTAGSGRANLYFIDKRVGLEMRRKREAEERKRKRREKAKLKQEGETAEAAGAEAPAAPECAKEQACADGEGAATKAAAQGEDCKVLSFHLARGTPGKRRPDKRSGRPAQTHNASTMSGGPSVSALSCSARSLAEMASLGSIGSLCAGARPRMVQLKKVRSQPTLAPLKPSWDDRHHVPVTPGNRLEKVVHQTTNVDSHHRERLALNMELLEREMPIEVWIRHQMMEKKRADARADAGSQEALSEDDDDW